MFGCCKKTDRPTANGDGRRYWSNRTEAQRGNERFGFSFRAIPSSLSAAEVCHRGHAVLSACSTFATVTGNKCLS